MGMLGSRKVIAERKCPVLIANNIFKETVEIPWETKSVLITVIADPIVSIDNGSQLRITSEERQH